MGCGHSNKLLSDSHLDNQNKEQYMKLKEMKEKIRQESKGERFIPESQKEYEDMCKEVITKMKGKGELSDSDLTECFYQLCSQDVGTKIYNEESNFKDLGEIITKLGAEYSTEEKETVTKIFNSEIGSSVNAAFLENKEKYDYLTRGIINGLRFGDIKSTAEALSIIIEEKFLFCEKTMVALKYLFKDLSKVKSLTIVVSNDDEKKEYKTSCYASKIFQGVELAKNVENFTFIRMRKTPIEFKADEMETLVDSVSSLNLKSLGIINLNFVKTSRKEFIQNICSNENLKMLGLQFDFTDDELKLIVPLIKGMPKLRLFLLGYNGCNGKDKDYRDELKKNLPKLEVFQVQYFDKN